MKKYAIYVGILIAGLLFGRMLFGGSTKAEATHNHDEVVQENQLWTCSMHPQIMQPEPGDCPICGMDLIPAEAGADGLTADQFKLTENAMALANVQTSVVGTANREGNTMTLSGTIVENENETATQPAHFNGRIEKLYVQSLGERVTRGQAVAQVYSPELVAAQQELITASKLKNTQPQLYKAVRNKFSNWKIHGAQLDEVERTGNVKTSFTIHSHVSGVVTEILADEGGHIMDGMPIFKVTNLNTVWALFDVYENQISQFKVGQGITVSTNAYPDEAFQAKTTFIDPVLDTQTRTVKIRAVLNNKDKKFKPGMFVEGQVESLPVRQAGLSGETDQTITVPATAVLWTGKRSVVYLKTQQDVPVFEMRKITLGNKVGQQYEVLSGLKNGDEIVTNGTFTVDAAAQLQGKKSMMNMNDVKPAITNMKMDLPKTFSVQFEKALKPYFKMKDALVNSDAVKASEYAKATLVQLQSIETTGLDKMATNHFDQSVEMVEIISEKEDLETQRKHFVVLNTNMVALAMNLSDLNETLFVQHCPMANNDEGAYWLSAEEQIRNPYFGESMLTCGSVEQVLNE